ncbi:MAG: hypothetical protein AAGF07_04990 [Patescibacteria group bacterium]
MSENQDKAPKVRMENDKEIKIIVEGNREDSIKTTEKIAEILEKEGIEFDIQIIELKPEKEPEIPPGSKD